MKMSRTKKLLGIFMALAMVMGLVSIPTGAVEPVKNEFRICFNHVTGSPSYCITKLVDVTIKDDPVEIDVKDHDYCDFSEILEISTFPRKYDFYSGSEEGGFVKKGQFTLDNAPNGEDIIIITPVGNWEAYEIYLPKNPNSTVVTTNNGGAKFNVLGKDISTRVISVEFVWGDMKFDYSNKETSKPADWWDEADTDFSKLTTTNKSNTSVRIKPSDFVPLTNITENDNKKTGFYEDTTYKIRNESWILEASNGKDHPTVYKFFALYAKPNAKMDTKYVNVGSQTLTVTAIQ